MSTEEKSGHGLSPLEFMVRRGVLTADVARRLPSAVEELLTRAFVCGVVTGKKDNARLRPRIPETASELDVNERMLQLLRDNGAVYEEGDQPQE